MIPETPSEGIKNLYAALMAAGKIRNAENLLIRFPSLKECAEAEVPKEAEVKKDGKKPKG